MPIAVLENAGFVAPPAPPECCEEPSEAVGSLVCQALLNEVNLTPKPGLVDRLNSGAHRDMDRATFLASIRAIAPWFPLFYRIGASTRNLPPEALLARIRPSGLACEAAMLRATGNVNTHKGSIFSMGLLSAAAGRLACFPTTLGDRYQNPGAPSFALFAKVEIPHPSTGLDHRELGAPHRKQEPSYRELENSPREPEASYQEPETSHSESEVSYRMQGGKPQSSPSPVSREPNVSYRMLGAPHLAQLHRAKCGKPHPSPSLVPLERPINLNCHPERAKRVGVPSDRSSSLGCGVEGPAFCISGESALPLGAQQKIVSRDQLCTEVAHICSGLVEAELQQPHTPRTAGEKLFQTHGLTGVRGEAASGFKTVRTHGLPAYERILDLGGSEEEALHEALLHLMAVNRDTNLVHRGGLAGLAHVQTEAKRLIASGGVRAPHFRASMIDFDADLTQRNLSPGGSADLLAVTCFLSRFPANL